MIRGSFKQIHRIRTQMITSLVPSLWKGNCTSQMDRVLLVTTGKKMTDFSLTLQTLPPEKTIKKELGDL
jgi:hypothetical protein